MQALEDGSIDIIEESVDYFRFQDLNALKVKSYSLGAHSISLDEHECAENPMIETSINVDPFGHKAYELISLQAATKRKPLVDAASEGSEISSVNIEEG